MQVSGYEPNWLLYSKFFGREDVFSRKTTEVVSLTLVENWKSQMWKGFGRKENDM